MTAPTFETQVNAAAAYEAFFVPALFEEWAHRVAAAARVGPGDRVLDVACGTGVLARAAADRVGVAGSVAGLDINPGMLAVAARQASQIRWRQGSADALPYEAGSFDAVVSQFGLMFFENQVAALKEMLRVLRPGGRLAVAVWGPLERSPGYAAFTDLLERRVGGNAADLLRHPFVLSDRNKLAARFAAAGMPTANVSTEVGTVRFPNVRLWVEADVKGWFPQAGIILNDAEVEALIAEAERTLGAFVESSGAVRFPIQAHIVTAQN